jgi:predicted site-specific integrase-resolvase
MSSAFTAHDGLAELVAGLPLVVTAKQLAEALGVSTTTLRAWVRRGLLPSPLPLTQRPRWTREALHSFLTRPREDASDVQ